MAKEVKRTTALMERKAKTPPSTPARVKATAPKLTKRSVVSFQARAQPPCEESVPCTLMATMMTGMSIIAAATTPVDCSQSGTGEPTRAAGPVQPAKRKKVQKATGAR